ncbi:MULTISPECIES: HalOD1 output domain-containing protein [Halorussus]|uniref:HalOD1 output domain-containing protein n=1 Tax=Halorussus TaxID=1070314 RepID=UPI00209DFDD6|nr:HalOD1 output domain-containing protein [Halorussus vallis]USZ77058.1 hypothetical protein NGM07_06955 [Halorussus vallis]
MKNSDPRTDDVVQVEHTDDRPLGVTVSGAIAEAKGVSALDLPRPLAEYVDVDALEALFRDTGSQSAVSVRFSAYGATVVVDGERNVSVSVES